MLPPAFTQTLTFPRMCQCPEQPTALLREQCEQVGAVRYGQSANYSYVPNPRMESTFMAVAMDLADVRPSWLDIHPRDKLSVGTRLALGARATAYGEDVYWTGPLVANATAAGDGGVRITFTHTGSSGLALKHGVGFEVLLQDFGVDDSGGSGANGWTQAPIVSHTANSVLVKANGGGSVAQVRYNFYQNPCMPTAGERLCAIYADGLPAPPFVMPVATSTSSYEYQV